MRDRMERLVVLPFSIGCSSQSSVAVCDQQPKAAKPESKPALTREEERGESLSGVRMKNSFGLVTIPKPNISTRIQRLIKSFKSLSQLFVYKEEDGGDMEMEIGCPTDVKHVSHIGWDGSTTTNGTATMKSWDSLKAPELLSSLHSISLRQFELAIAAQANETLA